MTDKQRLNQLEADIYTLARFLLDHQGAKPALVDILERRGPKTLETRPAASFEQGVTVS